MKNLVIIGAGSFGREVFEWARDMEAHGREWSIKGFLDDNPKALDDFGTTAKVLSTIKAYYPEEDDVFVCAVGTPRIKQRMVQTILSRGGDFINVVHPSVIMRRDVHLGHGVILCPRVTLSCDIVLRDFVTFNLHCCVGHDVTVGDWCQMSNLCDLCGHVVLEEGVFLGSHASILPGCRIGRDAVVGAGSVVADDVAPGVTVAGVPARILGSPRGNILAEDPPDETRH